MMSQVKKALTIAVTHVHPEFYGLSAKRFEVEVVCVCVEGSLQSHQNAAQILKTSGKLQLNTHALAFVPRCVRKTYLLMCSKDPCISKRLL